MKCNLFYSDSEWSMLDEYAKQLGAKDTLRLLFYRLVKRVNELPELDEPGRCHKERRMLRITNKAMERKLKDHARASGISVTVLIRRLSVDPVLLEAQQAKLLSPPPPPLPQSL